MAKKPDIGEWPGLGPARPFFYARFTQVEKMGNFHKGDENRMVLRPKRSDFITTKIQLLFDTPTLSKQMLCLLKARSSKQRL